MKQDNEKLYKEYQKILDDKLLQIGFEKSPERVDRGGIIYVSYTWEYFYLSLSFTPRGFLYSGRVRIDGTGELEINLLKSKKEEIIEAIDKWISMLDVWLAQNK